MEAIERGVEMPQLEGLFLEATLFGVACAHGRHARRHQSFRWRSGPADFKGEVAAGCTKRRAGIWRTSIVSKRRKELQPGKIHRRAQRPRTVTFGSVGQPGSTTAFITERLFELPHVDATRSAPARARRVWMWFTFPARSNCRWPQKMARHGEVRRADRNWLRDSQGETSHYDYVCCRKRRGACSLAQMDTGVPVIFLCSSPWTRWNRPSRPRRPEEWQQRASKPGWAAIEMAQLSRKLRASGACRQRSLAVESAAQVSVATVKIAQFAMQMLFQWEMSPQDPRKLELKFWQGAQAAEDTETFRESSCSKATASGRVRDSSMWSIAQHCDNWRFRAASAATRPPLVLRLAVHELALQQDAGHVR